VLREKEGSRRKKTGQESKGERLIARNSSANKC